MRGDKILRAVIDGHAIVRVAHLIELAPAKSTPTGGTHYIDGETVLLAGAESPLKDAAHLALRIPRDIGGRGDLC